MGPPSYMRSVVDRNVVVRRIPVIFSWFRALFVRVSFFYCACPVVRPAIQWNTISRKSPDSSVTMVTTLQAGRTRNLDLCPGSSKKFLFNETSMSAVGHTASEADYSPLSSRLRMRGTYLHCLICLQTCCLIKHLYTFTFFLPDNCWPADWIKEKYEHLAGFIEVYLKVEKIVRIVIRFVFRYLLFYDVTQRRLVVRCRRVGIMYRSHIFYFLCIFSNQK